MSESYLPFTDETALKDGYKWVFHRKDNMVVKEMVPINGDITPVKNGNKEIVGIPESKKDIENDIQKSN